VSARGTDGLPIWKNANIVPNDFLISERWPAMTAALCLKFLPRAPPRCNEQRAASHAIVKGSLARTIHFLEECGGKPVTAMLGIVAVETADLVSRFTVAAPSEVLLDWLVRGTVCLGAHERLCPGQGQLGAGGSRSSLAAIRKALGDV